MNRYLSPVFILLWWTFACPIVFGQMKDPDAYKIKVHQYGLSCSGEPKSMNAQLVYDNYGSAPLITLKANPNEANGYCIAWLDQKTNQIRISVIGADHHLKKEIVPNYIGKTGILGGFDVLPDNRYVVGYTKDNAHGDSDFEYWISVFDEQGDSIFTKRIFGDRPSTELNSKGRPIGHCSARISYDKKAKRIYFYLGHTQLYKDGLRHQGGYLGFLDETGKEFNKINGWFCSHNFDQRLLLADGKAYAMYHGDAYPRALGVGIYTPNETSRWRSSLKKVNFYDIDGNTGNNFTGSKIGNLSYQNNGAVGVSFATVQNKNEWQVGYSQINWLKGKLIAGKPTWFKPQKGMQAGLPMSVTREKGRTLVAFNEFPVSKSRYPYYSLPIKTTFYEVSNSGKILTEAMQFDSLELQIMHDMITLPNGNILWATGHFKNESGVEVSSRSSWGGDLKEVEGTGTFTVFEIQKVENNKRLYDSYEEVEYVKHVFDEKSGGFLIQNVDLKKGKKGIIQMGLRLAKQGDLVRVYATKEKGSLKYTNGLINSEPYKFLFYSKLNEKSILKIKDEMKKSGKNMVFIFKKPIDFDTFEVQTRKSLDKIKNARRYIIAGPNQIKRIEFPIEK